MTTEENKRKNREAQRKHVAKMRALGFKRKWTWVKVSKESN